LAFYKEIILGQTQKIVPAIADYFVKGFECPINLNSPRTCSCGASRSGSEKSVSAHGKILNDALVTSNSHHYKI